MPIRITSRELKPNNPLQHLVKATAKVVDMDVNREEKILDEKIEKATKKIIKDEVDTDLIKKLTKYGTSYDLVMSKLESMKKVDNYPSKAEQKVNKYSYQLFWPRDKTIGSDTILKSIIIQLNYEGNLYSFLFPARQLAEHDRYKLDHFNTVVDSSGKVINDNRLLEVNDDEVNVGLNDFLNDEIPETQFTIYDALYYYSTTNTLTPEIRNAFKRYKIITNDEYFDLNFNIKGHHIMVLYEKISGRHETHHHKQSEDKTETPIVPVVKSDEPDPKQDITDEDLKNLNANINFKVPLGDKVDGGKFTDLIHEIKDPLIRLAVINYFNKHPLKINGLDRFDLEKLKDLPYADQVIIGKLGVNDKDDEYNKYSSGQRNYLMFDAENKRLFLLVYLDYSDLYSMLDAKDQSSMTRKLNKHNKDVYRGYMRYLDSKKKPTTTTTTTTTNPVNHGLPVKKPGTK